jgi:subtilisin family serine protease
VVIAIIDSGVDLGHPDFAGRVLAGYDFVNGDNDPSDDYGHGTCCAGVALARGDNAAGIGAFTLPTYARAGWVGTQVGTLHQPWDSFPEGINAVPSGGDLVLSGGLYDLTGPVTVTKPMTIRGLNGVAVIGP